MENKLVKFICHWCGKEYFKWPCLIKRSKFCSKQCKHKAKKKAKCKICLTPIKKGRRYCTTHSPNNNRSVLVNCFFCGKQMKRYKNRLGEKSFCSDCRKLAHVQSGNPNWKNGIKPLNARIRSSENFNNWRKNIFKKDNYTCFLCGQIGGNLQAHHLAPFSKLIGAYKFYHGEPTFDSLLNYKPLWEEYNGITLCKSCHKKIPNKNKKDEVIIPKKLSKLLKKRIFKNGGVAFYATSSLEVFQVLKQLGFAK